MMRSHATAIPHTGAALPPEVRTAVSRLSADWPASSIQVAEDEDCYRITAVTQDRVLDTWVEYK